MNDESDIRFYCVLKTGRLLDHDLAVNVLTEHNIPFFRQMESVSGLTLAMPFQPSMEPGMFYKILVPEAFTEKARHLLCELPIDNTDNPDVFHFGATEKVKKGWRVYAWIMLALMLVGCACVLFGVG